MPTHKAQDHPKDNDESYEYFTHQVKTLLSWRAPSRPYRKKDRSYYTTIAIIVVLLILIAFLAQEFLLIGSILALSFVAYVLGFIPPEDIDYKISTQGVTIGEHFYHWDVLDSFWFNEREGYKILNLATAMRFPSQLMIVLERDQEDKVQEEVAKFLPFHEIAPKSTMENWAEKLQKYFPLENPHK
ncbi:MAG: hypothetical protein Q7S88_00750 [Candidatus Daviesbacteria bacterium]|nr:hypothetical protein [Candidatus Daviesbacteria bacterium]